MAKFLETTNVSAHLTQIINDANEKLILISPYLKMSNRIKTGLKDRNLHKNIDIRLIYGKKELQTSEKDELDKLDNIRVGFIQDVHAKCYLNEKAAMITSMNLYEYSQQNNYEMGIYIEKDDEPKLYNDIYEEVKRLVNQADYGKPNFSAITVIHKENTKSLQTHKGFCIHCRSEKELDPMQPYCRVCYKPRTPKTKEETVCHICGKPNNSSLKYPACPDCYRIYKNDLKFPH